MLENLLQVEDLHVHFQTDDGVVRAVNGVSFGVKAGETLGIVGESGSGKSVTNLAVMGLIPRPPGKIVAGKAFYRLQDLLLLSPKDMERIRGRRIAMIFQDPMTALNPFLTVGEQLMEMTRLHLQFDYDRALKHAIEMLERVGIPAAALRVHDYPHQFSGGMRQRVMIAMALSCQPEVLIADEPTTALDVTIQAQMLDLMRDLQREQGTAIVLITHDLGVVANVCHRVAVMYAGRIVEEAPVESLFAVPRHPYTRGLLASVPRWTGESSQFLKAIEGQPPNMANPPHGCPFHPRCPHVIERCRHENPALTQRHAGHSAACFVDVATLATEVTHG